MFIYNNMVNGNIKPKHWTGVRLTINIPNQAGIRNPRPLVMPVKWHPPEESWIKVNTDGALKVNTDGAFMAALDRAGGGSIVRDHFGKMLVALATPLKAHSALEAELLALHHGLELAKEFNGPIWIESDSEQAIALFNGTAWGPAQVRRAMARLFIFKRHHIVRATFIHREGNKAADLLAKMGLEQESRIRITSHNAPRMLKAIVRLDEMGIPNIRVRDLNHE